jgi:hypothetical protein
MIGVAWLLEDHHVTQTGAVDVVTTDSDRDPLVV